FRIGRSIYQLVDDRITMIFTGRNVKLLDARDGNLVVTRSDTALGSELWAIPIPIMVNARKDANGLKYACSAIASSDQFHPEVDVNYDGVVDDRDLDLIVKDWFETDFGDSNLDGVFDSADFVTAFRRGGYESGLGASWRGGDWNCDGQFDSADIVRAFRDGSYNRSAKAVDRWEAAAAIENRDEAGDQEIGDQMRNRA
ncbi:hypothetical protein ACFL2H_11000, partial [Planctomycetota bacterium]